MPEITAIKLQCDLVMRGGIASGLVYPRAIAKLAETYDFRSIGGTSVGAIAATGTSAAALGSKTGPDHFQTRLKRLPEELSQGCLSSLFSHRWTHRPKFPTTAKRRPSLRF
jgi:predicted acylesterase/phospholipase RssA